jgi:hypothetical protein
MGFRLATAQAERVVAGGKTIEVARVRITEAGQRGAGGASLRQLGSQQGPRGWPAMVIVADIFSRISDFASEYPKITGAISVGTVIGALWAYWKRPIIKVRLGKAAGSYAPVTVDVANQKGEVVGRQAKYLRLGITNAGLTTIKDCRGSLIKVTRRIGNQVTHFDTDVHPLGWSHYSQSDKRAPRTMFDFDA